MSLEWGFQSIVVGQHSKTATSLYIYTLYTYYIFIHQYIKYSACLTPSLWNPPRMGLAAGWGCKTVASPSITLAHFL